MLMSSRVDVGKDLFGPMGSLFGGAGPIIGLLCPGVAGLLSP